MATSDKNGEIASISLLGKQVEDADLIPLQQFPQLRELNIDQTQVTDDGLAHLEGLTQLKTLSLAGLPVTDAGLVHLKRMTALERLGIRHTRVTLGGLLQLFTRWQTRSLADALRVPAYYRWDGDYPQLQSATEVRTDESAPGEVMAFKMLKEQKSGKGLIFIDLERAGVTDREIPELAKLANVGALFLHNNAISDEGLAHLQRLKQLEVLWISGPAITGAGLAQLTPLINLHTLWITDATLRGDDLGHLAAFPGLQVLNLSGTAITDQAVTHIRQCRSLRLLIVDSCALSESSLRDLRRSLPELHIHFSQKAALAAIRGRERQERLLHQGADRGDDTRNVSTTVPHAPMIWIFGDEHFEQADLLQGGPRSIANWKRWRELATLRTVSFYDIEVPDEAVAALTSLPQLETVRLGRSRLNDESLAHLRTTRIKELYLSESTVTDAGLVHLKGMHDLASLSLSGTRTAITDAGIAQLSELTSLQSLDLRQAKITDDGLRHLSQLNALTSLQLRGANINEGLKHLSTLQNLTTIDLAYTSVSDRSLTSLYGLAHLKDVDLAATLVSPEGIQQLQQRLPSASIRPGTPRSLKNRQSVDPLRQLGCA